MPDHIPLGRRLAGLFIGYLRITTFTLGGGMVMLPLMEDEFVRRRGWLDSKDFLGVVTLINALPGVIAVNSSIIIGWKVARVPGVVAAVLGSLLPSVIIILVLAPLVAALKNNAAAVASFTAVRAAVAGLILMLVIRQSRRMGAGVREIILSLAALLAVRVGGIHPILVIPVAGIAGVLLYRDDDGEQSE